MTAARLRRPGQTPHVSIEGADMTSGGTRGAAGRADAVPRERARKPAERIQKNLVDSLSSVPSAVDCGAVGRKCRKWPGRGGHEILMDPLVSIFGLLPGRGVATFFSGAPRVGKSFFRSLRHLGIVKEKRIYIK